jgi:hypothetical protein
MKYAAEMRSDTIIIHTPSFMKTGLGIEEFYMGYTDTQATWRSHKPTYFQNTETRLKRKYPSNKNCDTGKGEGTGTPQSRSTREGGVSLNVYDNTHLFKSGYGLEASISMLPTRGSRGKLKNTKKKLLFARGAWIA